MKQRSLLSTILTIALLAFWGFSRIPRYHQFTEGDFDLGPSEYSSVSITSESASPVWVEVRSSGDEEFDAYLLDSQAMQVLTEWMTSDDLTQPQLNCLRKWEGVQSADTRDILMPKGEYYLVVDNTILGAASSEEPISVHYVISEKY